MPAGWRSFRAPKVIGELIITVEDRNYARSLVINNHPISGDDLQVRSLINCNEQGNSRSQLNPLEQHIMHFDFEGKRTAFTENPGVHDAVSNGETTVIQSRNMDAHGVKTTVFAGDSLFLRLKTYRKNQSSLST